MALESVSRLAIMPRILEFGMSVKLGLTGASPIKLTATATYEGTLGAAAAAEAT